MIWRLSCAALGAALLAGTLADARQEGRERATLAVLLRRSGLQQRWSPAATRAHREPDFVRSGLLLARALLAQAMEAQRLSGLPPAEAVREAAALRGRLSLARDLARDALRRRPTAWQAALVLGGSTYREWSMTADPKLFLRRQEWEAPLVRAHALAPGERDAEELRCGALLPLWSGLGDEREQLLPLLSRCFSSPAYLARVLPFWLEVERRVAVARAVLPPTPAAWQGLAEAAARRGDWDEHLLARRRADELLLADLTRRMQRAEALLARGAEATARAEMHAIVAATPTRLPAVPQLRRALARCPAGVPSAALQASAREIIDWAVERCVWGRCPLPPSALARLESWAGELPSSSRAAALLAAGQRSRAEALAATVEAPLADERWADYVLLLTRHSLATGDRLAAGRALAALAPERSGGALARALQAAATLSSAPGERTWPLAAWRWRRGVARLELLAEGTASGVELQSLVAPSTGAVVELRWDGAGAARRIVWPGQAVAVAVPVTPGPHLLELVPLAGGDVEPGSVRLTGT